MTGSLVVTSSPAPIWPLSLSWPRDWWWGQGGCRGGVRLTPCGNCDNHSLSCCISLPSDGTTGCPVHLPPQWKLPACAALGTSLHLHFPFLSSSPLGLRAAEQGLPHLLAPSTDPTVLSPSTSSEDPGSFRKADLCSETLGEFSPPEACIALVITPNSRKIPWRRKWQPTSGLLPGQSHRQSKLVGYSP